MIYKDLLGMTVVCSDCGSANDPNAEWCEGCLRDLDVAKRALARGSKGRSAEPVG